MPDGSPAAVWDDPVIALRALCRCPTAWAGMVAGDRTGPLTGLTG
jgi:hypothetical protein